MVQISDKNSNYFLNIRSGTVTKILPSSSPFSKDEGLRDTGNSMSIGYLILDVNSVTVSYLIHYDSLLQNVADIITKCVSYFITKCHRSLLQNATVLLQTETVITNCDNFVTKCDSYYKMRRLLQFVTVNGYMFMVAD